MAAQFETGHAKNVANFNSVVSFCQGYGSTYNPALTAIQLSNLQTLAASALTALEECKSKQLDYDQAVDARMLAFAELRPLSQKMVYALKASGAPALSVEGRHDYLPQNTRQAQNSQRRFARCRRRFGRYPGAGAELHIGIAVKL